MTGGPSRATHAIERLARVHEVIGESRIGNGARAAVTPRFPGEKREQVREPFELRLPRPRAAADAVKE